MKIDYTREELIALCERARVPQDKWMNRDSERAQRQIGEAWALLSAGCEFQVCVTQDGSGCSTDDDTIWIETFSKGFNYFESYSPEEGDIERDYMESETSYIPTAKRLEEAAGGDWY